MAGPGPWIGLLAGILAEGAALLLPGWRRDRPDRSRGSLGYAPGMVLMGIVTFVGAGVALEALERSFLEGAALILVGVAVLGVLILSAVRPALVLPTATLPSAAASVVVIVAFVVAASWSLPIVPWWLLAMGGIAVGTIVALARDPTRLAPDDGEGLGRWPQAILGSLAVGSLVLATLEAGRPLFGFLAGYTDGAPATTMALHGVVLTYGASQVGLLVPLVARPSTPGLARGFSIQGARLGPTLGAVLLTGGLLAMVWVLWSGLWKATVVLTWAGLPVLAGLWTDRSQGRPGDQPATGRTSSSGG